MTVCVAIKVYDCIVFAADSAISQMTRTPDGETEVNNVWMHGEKVINLHRDLPIVAMSTGMGNYGSESVTNLTKEFRVQLTRSLDKENYTIEYVADSAKRFFEDKFAAIDPPPANASSLEFWIGGYSSEANHGEIWTMEFDEGRSLGPTQIASPSSSNLVRWSGQVPAISRLIFGIDPLINEALENLKLNKTQVRRMQSVLSMIQTPLVDAEMPVQDAIDLADFLVDLTKRYVAFLPGADTVGGETDIATVTKYEGFKWIRRKHYYSSHLNRRETDHAK